MTKLKAHPDAELFAMYSEEALDALAESIKKNGLDVPIVLYQGMILDGRNRYLACERAGVEPRFTTYEGDDPLEKVQMLNADRRDSTPPQRAITAARVYERERVGYFSPPNRNGQSSLRRIASRYKISKITLQQALEILAEAPDLAEQLERGLIPHFAKGYDELQARRKVAKQRDADAQRIAEYKDAIEAGEMTMEEALQKVMEAEREEREKVRAVAEARRQWLTKLVEFVAWAERQLVPDPDEQFLKDFDPASPGWFDHKLTAERLDVCAAQIGRLGRILSQVRATS